MSVYKPKNSRHWHFDFQFKGRRYYGSTGCEAKRAAEQFERRERTKVALGEDKPDITVDNACDIWWVAKGQHMKSKATLRYQILALATGLGKARLLADLGYEDFTHYVARRRNGRKNASVNREVQLARRVWRHATACGYSVAEIEWGKLMLSEPKERVRELSADEEKRLLTALPHDLRQVVEFAIMCGQRRTEVIMLRWADVDLAAGRATVQAKGGKPHSFPLTPKMIAHIANQPKVGPMVFTYECERPAPQRGDRPKRLKGGRYPFSKQGWVRKWNKALTNAGIEDFRFHDLRHTTGTRTLRASGNLKAVQKLLGHADITTTARYAHALEEDVRDILLAAESRNSPEAAKVRSTKNRRNARS